MEVVIAVHFFGTGTLANVIFLVIVAVFFPTMMSVDVPANVSLL